MLYDSFAPQLPIPLIHWREQNELAQHRCSSRWDYKPDRVTTSSLRHPNPHGLVLLECMEPRFRGLNLDEPVDRVRSLRVRFWIVRESLRLRLESLVIVGSSHPG